MPAFGAPCPFRDPLPNRAERQRELDAMEDQVRSLEMQLPHAPPATRANLNAELLRLKGRIFELRSRLRW